MAPSNKAKDTGRTKYAQDLVRQTAFYILEKDLVNLQLSPQTIISNHAKSSSNILEDRT